jgi:hypothetical protein
MPDNSRLALQVLAGVSTPNQYRAALKKIEKILPDPVEQLALVDSIFEARARAFGGRP